MSDDKCRCGHERDEHLLEPPTECTANNVCGCTRFRAHVLTPGQSEAVLQRIEATTPPTQRLGTPTTARLGAPWPPAPPAPVEPSVQLPVPSDLAKLLALGRASDVKATSTLVARIVSSIEELRSRVEGETHRRETLERIQRLQASIDKARAELGVKPTGRNGGRHVITLTACAVDGCEKQFDTAQGLSMHRSRAHR